MCGRMERGWVLVVLLQCFVGVLASNSSSDVPSPSPTSIPTTYPTWLKYFFLQYSYFANTDCPEFNEVAQKTVRADVCINDPTHPFLFADSLLQTATYQPMRSFRIGVPPTVWADTNCLDATIAKYSDYHCGQLLQQAVPLRQHWNVTEGASSCVDAPLWPGNSQSLSCYVEEFPRGGIAGSNLLEIIFDEDAKECYGVDIAVQTNSYKFWRCISLDGFTSYIFDGFFNIPVRLLYFNESTSCVGNKIIIPMDMFCSNRTSFAPVPNERLDLMPILSTGIPDEAASLINTTQREVLFSTIQVLRFQFAGDAYGLAPSRYPSFSPSKKPSRHPTVSRPTRSPTLAIYNQVSFDVEMGIGGIMEYEYYSVSNLTVSDRMLLSSVYSTAVCAALNISTPRCSCEPSSCLRWGNYSIVHRIPLYYYLRTNPLKRPEIDVGNRRLDDYFEYVETLFALFGNVKVELNLVDFPEAVRTSAVKTQELVAQLQASFNQTTTLEMFKEGLFHALVEADDMLWLDMLQGRTVEDYREAAVSNNVLEFNSPFPTFAPSKKPTTNTKKATTITLAVATTIFIIFILMFTCCYFCQPAIKLGGSSAVSPETFSPPPPRVLTQ